MHHILNNDARAHERTTNDAMENIRCDLCIFVVVVVVIVVVVIMIFHWLVAGWDDGALITNQ